MPLDHYKLAYEILFGDADEGNLQQTIRDRPPVLTISWDEMVSAIQRTEILARQQLIEEQRNGEPAELTDALTADRNVRSVPSGGGRRIGGPGGGLVTRTVPFAGAAAVTTREASSRVADRNPTLQERLSVEGYADVPPGRRPPNPTGDPEKG